MVDDLCKEILKEDNKYIWVRMRDGIYLVDENDQSETKIEDFIFRQFRYLKKALREINLNSSRYNIRFNYYLNDFTAVIFEVEDRQDIIIRKV